MTIVKIKSGDWEVEVATSHVYSYASDIVNFLTASIESAVKNYIEPKSTIKQSDMDIKDNQIELLKEDLEVVHMYLDDLGLPRKDDSGETYSIVGRIKQMQMRQSQVMSELESQYLNKLSESVDSQTVARLLEAQRGNCYVAVLNKTRDEEIAKAAGAAPEPGGNWKEYYLKSNSARDPLVELCTDAE